MTDEGFLTKETLFMKEVHASINKVSELTDKIIRDTLNKKIFISKYSTSKGKRRSLSGII